MTIDANDPRITAYVFGELHGNELADFETALEQSRELQAIVDQTRKTIDLVESDLAAAPPTRLSQEQRAMVAAQFDEAGQWEAAVAKADKGAPIPLSGEPRPFPVWGVAVLAATLLLVVGAGLFLAAPRQMVVTQSATRTTDEAQMEPAYGVESEDAIPAMPSAARSMEEGMGMGRGVANGARGPGAADFGAAGGDMGGAGGMGMGGIPAEESAPFAPATSPALDSAPEPAPTAPGAPAAPGAGAADAGMLPAPRGSKALKGQAGLAPLAKVESDAAPLPGGVGDAEEPAAPFDAAPTGDRFDTIVENDFQLVRQQPLSTFSIDVDTASYSKLRQYLQNGILPQPNAVRLEELINYFPYGYEPPSEDAKVPFAAHLAVSECPWNSDHRLVRIAIKGKEFVSKQRPPANLVFLVDVSGSMQSANKLPLLRRGLRMLTQQLRADDRVSIVVYAGAAGLVLEPTPGDQKEKILGALDRLRAGGSTNGGQGIKLAYLTAMDHFMEKGVNRVILCSDGDFNVGVTGAPLVRLVEQNAKSKVFLTVLGFGMGNHNDAMMEQISNRGNGNYAFIDNDTEAAKVLVDQLSGTLVTIAKDVKIQVDFNPKHVASYRMLGYENRQMANRDFDNDAKDAGEIGAGHSVTMLYEIVPTDPQAESDLQTLVRPPQEVDDGEPQSKYLDVQNANSNEMLTLFMRYKQPDEDQSTRLSFPLKTNALQKFGAADVDFRFAASVASFGLLLRDSQYQGDTSYDAVLEIAAEAAQQDPLRLEFLQLVRQARALSQ